MKAKLYKIVDLLNLIIIAGLAVTLLSQFQGDTCENIVGLLWIIIIVAAIREGLLLIIKSDKP